MSETNGTVVIKAKSDRKVFKPAIKTVNRIPQSLFEDPKLNQAISILPANYNLEIHKTIWRIQQTGARRVGLQMPDGLLLFATTLCDIIETFTGADTVIMGDVTYGACCVDDYTAKALDVDLLVHYGHSCLVPIDQTSGIKMLYIFVDIKIDATHFLETVRVNFTKDTRLGMVSTIQFAGTLQNVAVELKKEGYRVTVPQSRPLSPGEILGCTAPVITDVDIFIYLGDGRFHLEAAMIANPKLRAFRYDPYDKKFTEEFYDHTVMRDTRKQEISKAKSASKFGLILGILGRQGNPKVMKHFQDRLKEVSKNGIIILLSEILPQKLSLFPDIGAWIQIACPRLSIDWGNSFSKPLLTPYEGAVVLNEIEWQADEERNYPMDFYANESAGPWTPNHKPPIKKKDIKCCDKPEKENDKCYEKLVKEDV